MKKLLYILLLNLIIVTTGCECIRDGNGVVIDSITGETLDSVTVKSYESAVKEKNFVSEMITDSTGMFSGETRMHGTINSCPDLVMVFSRHGYTTLTITNLIEGTVTLSEE